MYSEVPSPSYKTRSGETCSVVIFIKTEPLRSLRMEMDCYRSNFPGLSRFKNLAADKHVIPDLPLVRFVIINLTRLTAGVSMKVSF